MKVILLDIDGVLIDDTNVFYDSVHKHFNISKDEFMEFYNSDYKKSWIAEVDLKEVLYKWLKQWKIETNADDFLKVWFESENRPNQNLINLVKEYKNIFLCTTQEKNRLNYILREMKFNEFSKEAFASFMFKVRKPSLDFYEKVFERLEKYFPDLQPNEVLFFDDSLSNVEGANQFGFKAYQYTDFQKCKKIIEENFKKI